MRKQRFFCSLEICEHHTIDSMSLSLLLLLSFSWSQSVIDGASFGDFAFPPDFKRATNERGYHHHHHGYDRDQDDSYEFRGNEGVQGTLSGNSSSGNNSLQVPLDFVRKINQYTVNDLLLNFLDGDVEEPATLEDRFGADGADERGATAIRPKEAGCLPELTTVKIVENNDPTVFYIPQCTRVERCGGCCSHPLLKCQPEEKESLNFRVLKTQYTGNQKLKLVAKEIVSVEKHTKCKCDCRIQPEDCKPFQEYQKNDCRCACTNFDEEKKCSKGGDLKLWNPDLCICQCRHITACTTGTLFDQSECKCKPAPMKRRYADFERPDSSPSKFDLEVDY